MTCCRIGRGNVTSIVIAAHNEEPLIGACLDAVIRDADGAEIIVVANGCTDRTPEVARTHPGVAVLELAEGNKPEALNAGDRVATSFPRIYLDADIVVPSGCISGLVSALTNTGALAAVPRRAVVTQGRPWPVRAYFRVNERLPAYQEGLFGRGIIALSESGRARFNEFPLMVADDLFLDSHFAADEKIQVAAFTIEVETPARTGELLRRLERVRRGNAAMRQAGSRHEVDATIRSADRWSWLRDVVAGQPRLWPAGAVYGLMTVYASAAARFRSSSTSLDWGRTSRR